MKPASDTPAARPLPHAGTDPDQVARFHDALMRLYRRVNVMQRGEKRCLGLTLPQCSLLEMLRRRSPRTVRELADGLGLDQSTVTRGIDVLVRDGYVRRMRDEDGDRRRVHVSLTTRGTETAATLEASTAEVCREILERLPAGRQGDVVAALRGLADAVDANEPCCD